MKYIIISAIILCIAVFACNKTSSNPDYVANAVCTGTTPTYNTNISSIINTSCATSGCHNDATRKSGISLQGYSNASSQFKNNSKNLASINHGSGVDPMPQGAPKLADSNIKKLECWVKNGTPQ